MLIKISYFRAVIIIYDFNRVDILKNVYTGV